MCVTTVFLYIPWMYDSATVCRFVFLTGTVPAGLNEDNVPALDLSNNLLTDWPNQRDGERNIWGEMGTMHTLNPREHILLTFHGFLMQIRRARVRLPATVYTITCPMLRTMVAARILACRTVPARCLGDSFVMLRFRSGSSFDIVPHRVSIRTRKSW